MQHVRPGTHLAFQAQEHGVTPMIWRVLCGTTAKCHDKESGLDWEKWEKMTKAYHRRGLSTMWSWRCRLGVEIIKAAIGLNVSGATDPEVDERAVAIALRNTEKPAPNNNDGQTMEGQRRIEARDQVIANLATGEVGRTMMGESGCKAKYCRCMKGDGYVHCQLRGDQGCDTHCYCSRYHPTTKGRKPVVIEMPVAISLCNAPVEDGKEAKVETEAHHLPVRKVKKAEKRTAEPAAVHTEAPPRKKKATVTKDVAAI